MALTDSKLSTLRHLVRLGLGSPDKETVFDDEIDYHLSKSQDILNREGQILRKSGTASSVANQERYSFPTDIVTALRIDYDGKKMKFIDYDDISELDVS